MGACACAINNTSNKYQQNEITAGQEQDIDKQIDGIVVEQGSLSKTLLKTLSTKKMMSVKQKTHSDQNQDLPYINWSSLISNKDSNLYAPQKTLSQYSNTLPSNQSNIIDLEEKQKIGSSQSQLQQDSELPKIIQKQTAKNRNWNFNRSSMLNQGLREEDNALIERTLDLQFPIKLQAIQLKVGVTYYGQWMNAMRHGYGIQIWEDDSRYEGQWEFNQQAGPGVLRYSDGDMYEGQWKDDCFNGQGKYICQNGHLYEGQWFQGRKDGNGTEKWGGEQIYIGEFKQGLKHGRGIIKFKDGSYYQGQFASNFINGRGKYVWINNRQYDGQWLKNKMNGFGILKWIDGRYYKGQFLNDKRHGKGEMYYVDGSRYNGNWKEGKQDGHGQVYQGTKLKYVGQWKDGKKVKKHNKYESSQSCSISR